MAVSTFTENRRAGIIPVAVAAAEVEPGNGDAGEAASAAAAAEPALSEAAAASEPSQRDAADKIAPMGRAAHDVVRRTLASLGELAEARPTFGAARNAVARGGVLTAVPMLLREGLPGDAARILQLSKGFYGLATMLLFVAFLALARVRSAERLRYQAPGEWGALLGLDRGPEVKTLRRKLRQLTRRLSDLREWRARLSRRWAADAPKMAATIAVDGHVQVYSGRKGKLPKHYVARQKLALPASVAYWLNALGGAPLLRLHQDLDPKWSRRWSTTSCRSCGGPGSCPRTRRT